MVDELTSSKPYLIRAIYEWLLDNNLTPYIAVDTSIPGVKVPKQFINDNRIILNIAPKATNNLRIGNDALEFRTCFGGISHAIYIPTVAIAAIYAQENNRGMVFPPEETSATTPPKAAEQKPAKTKKQKPRLKLVK